MQTHYFQRYHSKENVHTANAMLLFARIYHHDPKLFFGYLESELLDGESGLDVSFNLQQRGPESVPDATIGQPSFKLVIETKYETPFRRQQIEGHLQAFGREKYRVLITLDKSDLPTDARRMINQVVESANDNRASKEAGPIRHVHLRFRDLIEQLEPYIDERDSAMVEMFDDYKGYCHESNLIDNSDWVMLSVSASNSYEECRTYNLYFDVARKIGTYEGQRYLGLYRRKQLRAVGTVKKIVTVSRNEDGTLSYDRSVNSDEENRIVGAVAAARTHGDLTVDKEPYVFTLVDNFERTQVIKESKYAGFQQWKYTDISKLMDSFPQEKRKPSPPGSRELADFLNGKSWEEFRNGDM